MSFNCNVCNKEYKSYKSLWHHNSIFHPEQKININRNDKKIREYECIKCNKKFTTKQSMNSGGFHPTFSRRLAMKRHIRCTRIQFNGCKKN